ncbi:MAG: tRNA pseudouridine(55) synthase TruB [Clostridia bacterium]|nr:tRNA pseudouridine(55) synthase TruB [Clostridia bacterium]
MKDGIINIYKPEGVTSNDVIYMLRNILRIKKLGHTGTLDPLATGVLPILINKGTRVASYMDIDFKEYRCTLILGVSTDTLDVMGEVTEKTDEEIILEEEKVKEGLDTFLGLIDQIPPMYSAVRINGRKLYSYMHSAPDAEIEAVMKKIKPRQVFIEDITLDEMGIIDRENIKYPVKEAFISQIPFITFTVKCSKGTYIRSICRDLSDFLGYPGTMLSLERTASGEFRKENSVDVNMLKELAIKEGLAEIREDGKFRGLGEIGETIPPVLEKYILPLDYPLKAFGKVVVDSEMRRKFIDGWHLSFRDIRVVKEPEYDMPVKKEELRDANPDSESNHHGSYPGLKVKDEYLGAYCIYDEEDTFLGVSIYSDIYKKLVADKVLIRDDNI